MVSLCRVNPAVDYSLFLLGPTLYRMLRRKLVIGPSWIRWAMLKAFFQFMDFVERFPSGYGTSGYAAGALNTLYLCAFLWRTPPSPNGSDVEQNHWMCYASSDIHLLGFVVHCKADMFFCGIWLPDWICLSRRQYWRSEADFVDWVWGSKFFETLRGLVKLALWRHSLFRWFLTGRKARRHSRCC